MLRAAAGDPDHDVWRVLATGCSRVLRLARRLGIDVEGDGISVGERRGELADESSLLADLAGASLAERSVPRANAGARTPRIGHATDDPPNDATSAAASRGLSRSHRTAVYASRCDGTPRAAASGVCATAGGCASSRRLTTRRRSGGS